MKYIKQYLFACAVLGLMALAGCSDQWDERTGSADPSVSDKSLIQLVHEDGDLRIFYDILVELGYDQVLAGAGMASSGMTVFAPTDDVLRAHSISAATNRPFLLALVKNHISLTSNLTGIPGAQQRIKMANGKGFTFDSQNRTIDGLPLIGNNRVGRNGVLQVVDGLLTARPSIWEYICQETFVQTEAVKEFMDYRVFDESSEIIEYTPEGVAVYDSLFFDLSTYLENLPVDNEDSLYVYVVLENDAYVPHHGRYSRILKQIKIDERPDPRGTDSITALHMNMDLTFRVPKVNGAFDFSLKPVMKSVQGVNVYFNLSDVVSEQMLSNGKLYVVRNCQIPLANNKIKPIWIEGESCQNQPYGDFPGDSLSNKVIQIRSWASGGKTLLAQGQQFIRFRPVVFSVPYKFYWRMGNHESRDSVPLRQRLYISNPGAYMVAPNNTMTIPGMTNTTGGHVRYNTLDPNYPDRSLENLNAQVTTYYFFSAVQDTVRDARRLLSASDTSSMGAQWYVARYYTQYVAPDSAQNDAGVIYPVYTANSLGGSLTPDQIARVRAGETIDVGYIARADYMQENQLFFTQTVFHRKSSGAPIGSGSKATSDLAHAIVSEDIDSYTFESYGQAGLAVNRDMYNRANNWQRVIYWNTSSPRNISLSDFSGVYLDYMRLVPVVDDYEGFPVDPE